MSSFTKGWVGLQSERLRIMMALVGLCSTVVYSPTRKAMNTTSIL
jgi:hypothetical protein